MRILLFLATLTFSYSMIAGAAWSEASVEENHVNLVSFEFNLLSMKGNDTVERLKGKMVIPE